MKTFPQIFASITTACSSSQDICGNESILQDYRVETCCICGRISLSVCIYIYILLIIFFLTQTRIEYFSICTLFSLKITESISDPLAEIKRYRFVNISCKRMLAGKCKLKIKYFQTNV